jgi:hypothetical protein
MQLALHCMRVGAVRRRPVSSLESHLEARLVGTGILVSAVCSVKHCASSPTNWELGGLTTVSPHRHELRTTVNYYELVG